MDGSYEQHEGYIATTAGFPGIYPCDAVASYSPTIGQAADQGTVPKADTEQGCGNLGNRFDGRNVEVSNVRGNGEKEVLLNPFNLPDEDFLDLMFVPLSKEDRIRLSGAQTMAKLFRELLPDFPGSGTDEAEAGGDEQNVTQIDMVLADISDDEYMDKLFAPLSEEDKVRLSAYHTKESLFEELLGEALLYESPHMCEEGMNDAASRAADGDREANEQAGSTSVRNATMGTQDVTMILEVPNPVMSPQVPIEPRVVVPRERAEPLEVAPTSNTAPQKRQRNPPNTANSSKRKRSSRKKVAKSTGEEAQGRPQKRRRTRVEDMNPADVHDCPFENCGKRFARRYNLTIHERGHRNEYPFRCAVPGCGKPFMWQSSMERHLVVHDKRRKSGGGRKQRGRSAKSKKLGEPRYPASGAPSAVGNQLRGVENVQAIVNTTAGASSRTESRN